MKIIQQPDTEVRRKRRHSFRWVKQGDGGLSFDVDEHGEPISLCGKKNFTAWQGMEQYIRAILGPEWAPFGYEGEEGTDTSFEIINEGIVTDEIIIRIPRAGLCNCGRKVTLDRFTNPCSCGLDYNMFGELLAPRHLWGEETGEHWSECI